jgi:hypothetical protein
MGRNGGEEALDVQVACGSTNFSYEKKVASQKKEQVTLCGHTRFAVQKSEILVPVTFSSKTAAFSFSRRNFALPKERPFSS